MEKEITAKIFDSLKQFTDTLHNAGEEEHISINYFDMCTEEVEGDQVITFKLDTKIVNIRDRKMSFSFTELASHFEHNLVDIMDMTSSIMTHELRQAVVRSYIEKVAEMGRENYSKAIAAHKNLRYLNKLVDQGRPDLNAKLLSYRITTLANILSSTSRMGSGNIVICNVRYASALQDLADYKAATVNVQDSGGIYLAGRIYKLDIYVDPSMKWDDTTVHIFRKLENNHAGLHVVYNDKRNQLVLDDSKHGVVAIKKQWDQPFLIEALGSNPEVSYMTVTFDEDNRTWWQKVKEHLHIKTYPKKLELI